MVVAGSSLSRCSDRRGHGAARADRHRCRVGRHRLDGQRRVETVGFRRLNSRRGFGGRSDLGCRPRDVIAAGQCRGGVSSQPQLVSGDCVGQYTDPTSLIYLRARMYDPATGQFLTVDPLVDSTHSPYAYVAGNPLNATDPTGLCKLFSWGGNGCAAQWAADVPGGQTLDNSLTSFVGFGDTLTGGLSRDLRHGVGLGGAINECSASYRIGSTVGTVTNLAIAVVSLPSAIRSIPQIVRSVRSLPALLQGLRSSTAASEDSGLLSGLKGRLNAARLAGNDSGAISLGGHEFSDDEIAQLTYQHIGEGDIPGRPSLDEISAVLKNAQGVPLEGQNALQYEYGGVRVIVNGDAPWRSTAYYPGK
jgi:RHS repeat-associated protein